MHSSFLPHWPYLPASPSKRASSQRDQLGFSLIIVLLILVVVSILGVGGIQISMMAERATRNDRDLQVAWQSAEAALTDAEMDILGQPVSYTTKRGEIFDRKKIEVSKFIQGCGKSTDGKGFGLCAPIDAPDTKPDWLTVDFTQTGKDANTVGFGTFTGRAFPAGGAGLQPAAAPRYVIEILKEEDPTRSQKDAKYIYRVTSLGFGPSTNTQAVLQMIYRN